MIRDDATTLSPKLPVKNNKGRPLSWKTYSASLQDSKQSPVNPSVPARWTEGIVKLYQDRVKLGYSLFHMTINFKSIPKFRAGKEVYLEHMGSRIERLWKYLLSRLYRDKKTDSSMTVFWEFGDGGLHAHCVFCVNWDRARNSVKDKYAGFLEFWKTEHGRFLGYEHDGEKEFMSSAVVGEWDGREMFLMYCCKGFGGAVEWSDTRFFGSNFKERS